METVLLLPPPAKAPEPKPAPKSFIAESIKVPIGYVVDGVALKIPFPMLALFGIRWHPDWSEPRIYVRSFRFLALGDALASEGEDVCVWPVSENLRTLAPLHGKAVRDLTDAELMAWVKVADALGLSVPDKPEPLASFIVRQ